MNLTYLVYDVEIVRCIPNGVRTDLFEYCDGWDDFENMGISVCGFAVTDQSQAQVFDWDDANKRSMFKDLVQAFPIAGFNSKAFDDQLLAANGFEIRTDLDILEQIRISSYGSPLWQDCPKGYSYRLDAICEANGLKKTGHGALAPQWWQMGEKQKVRDYCRNDADIERAVLKKFLVGELIDPNTGGLVISDLY